ncbi:MAG: TetR/AcrR family transcriptional regulator [Clostridia bacterium]|nr:TetR/AcrR family transcriptional regulator [Clostridia bacterium]
MARIDKGAITKLEIVAEASKQFLQKGYSSTTISSISQALEMSKGNLTFYYQTKEHLLAELVDLLCSFQWRQMENEADDGISSIMAICLELTAMAEACEDDEVIKDFFISAYTSPICLNTIRKNDKEKAKQVFKQYRLEWTDVQFEEAELLISGIEYATLMTAGSSIPLETRISGALNIILGIYGIPEDIRKAKIQRVFEMDYRTIGKKTIADFKKHVENSNDQALRDILNIK